MTLFNRPCFRNVVFVKSNWGDETLSGWPLLELLSLSPAFKSRHYNLFEYQAFICECVSMRSAEILLLLIMRVYSKMLLLNLWCWLCKLTGFQVRGKWPESLGTRVKDVWARAGGRNLEIVVFLELAALLVRRLSSSGRFPRGPCAGYSPV